MGAGDRVRVVVAKAKRRLRYGRIVAFEARSPFRVEPRCPHFGECGGCTFQNLAYAKQLEIKETYLLRTLQKIGGVSLDGVRREPISPSPPNIITGARWSTPRSRNGQVFLGLQRSTPSNDTEKHRIASHLPHFQRSGERFSVLVDFAIERLEA
jgi:23S rRNA (uracil1939-C5)-methyltransferase